MKRFLALSTLCLFLSGNFQTGLVWVNYTFQKKTITELFCVNKSKPELQCEGKCHVKKLVNKDLQEDQGIPGFEMRFLDPCIIDEGVIGHEPPSFVIYRPEGTIAVFQSHLSRVFHPPKPVC